MSALGQRLGRCSSLTVSVFASNDPAVPLFGFLWKPMVGTWISKHLEGSVDATVMGNQMGSV